MVLGEDFKFRDDIKADTVPIELLTGPYKGVVLRFTRVELREQLDETAKCIFSYDLFKTGEHTEMSLRKNNQFTEHIGIILNELILETCATEDDNESFR